MVGPGMDFPIMHDSDQYELVRDVGSGNFGVARLMRDKQTEELVVVKYIERGEKIRYSKKILRKMDELTRKPDQCPSKRRPSKKPTRSYDYARNCAQSAQEKLTQDFKEHIKTKLRVILRAAHLPREGFMHAKVFTQAKVHGPEF